MQKPINISAFRISLAGEQTQIERDFTRDDVLRITGISSSTLVRREHLLRRFCPEFTKPRYGQIYALMDLWILIYARDFINEFACKDNPENPNWVYGVSAFSDSLQNHGIPLNLYQEFKTKVQKGEIEL
jgi:hypothetical protein